MKKPIKSIWQGKIGLHEKYIKECLQKEDGMELTYTGREPQYDLQRMTISQEHIRKGIMGKEMFPERHGTGFYRLIYFEWVPDKDPQQSLL